MKKIIFSSILCSVLIFSQVATTKAEAISNPSNTNSTSSIGIVKPMLQSAEVIKTETLIQMYQDGAWYDSYSESSTTIYLNFSHGYYLSGETATYSTSWTDDNGFLRRYKYTTYSYTTY
jgi:hypothetical protein